MVFLGLSIAPAAYAQQTVVPDAAAGKRFHARRDRIAHRGCRREPGTRGIAGALCRRPGGKGGSLGLLGTKSVMDSPFSTSSYTSELIEDQQGRTAADTLINDSSVRLTTGSNGFDDSFQIRGFSVSSTDVGLNGLYGLLSSNRAQAQYIERIELLRGRVR
ncbi:TonB-dependent receptor plug domain-containing protein [Pseudoroseomonas wenyumeiae]